MRYLPLLLLLILFPACSARVTGYESPIAHDYAAVAWQPLTTAVTQPFVAGTGYSDAIANDPMTTPAQFQHRMAALPDDARNGDLRELRLGVRLRDDHGEQWQSGSRAQLLYAPELDTRWPEEDFHAWRDGDRWLDELAGSGAIYQEFTSPYPMLSGVTVRIATFGGDLTPGEATVGSLGADVLDLPIDGAPLGTLAAGQQVTVTTALEGWAQLQLPDGRTGYAPLEAFAILPPPARAVRGALHVVLQDKVTGEQVRCVDVPAAQLHDNSHLDISFAPLPDSLGRTYWLELSMPGAEPGSGLTLRGVPTVPSSPSNVLVHADALGFTPVNLVFRPLYAAARPALDEALDELPRDGDWLRVTAPPAIASGAVVALRIVPGAGPDSGRLEYGLTPQRVPFGGWFAHDDAGASIDGALLVSTIYEREVGLGGLLHAALARLRGGARTDVAFSALYALLLVTLLVGAARLALGGRRWARDGR